MRTVAPDLLLPPLMLVLQRRSLWKLLREGENQGDDVLRYNRSMNLRRVCEHYVAVHQLRKQELMNSGRRSMNPVQFLAKRKLLRINRKSKDNFRVAKVRFRPVVGISMQYRDAGKILCEPLWKPSRNSPEVESVMNSDQEV